MSSNSLTVMKIDLHMIRSSSSICFLSYDWSAKMLRVGEWELVQCLWVRTQTHQKLLLCKWFFFFFFILNQTGEIYLCFKINFFSLKEGQDTSFLMKENSSFKDIRIKMNETILGERKKRVEKSPGCLYRRLITYQKATHTQKKKSLK